MGIVDSGEEYRLVLKLRREVALTIMKKVVGQFHIPVLAATLLVTTTTASAQSGKGVAKDHIVAHANTSGALIQDFISKDPLGGEDGLPPSPAAPLAYGPINVGLDVDGDAIQAVDENDLRYFDGHYYLYGPSFTCGSFNYAPGVSTGPLIPTKPPSFYRYCGLTI